MTCQEYDVDIGDYIDGTLPADRAVAFDAHLSSCTRCRAMAADFRTLRSAAASLDRRNAPPHVWTRVAAELNAQRQHQDGSVDVRWRWAARHDVAPGGRRRCPCRTPGRRRVVVVARSVERGSSTQRRGGLSSADRGPFAGQVHAGHRAGDDRDLESRRHRQGRRDDEGGLPGERGAHRQRDRPDECGAGKEPSNVLAQQSLFEALRSKLALLQEMIALINEMRKGNQEGAARIVSGMDQ